MDNDNFVVISKIKYEEASEFFKAYLKEVNIITFFYYICLLLSFVGLLLSIINNFSFSEIMTNLGYVVIFAIPYGALHEVLHLLAYKIIGGEKPRIKIKKGIINSSCKEKLFKNNKYIIGALLPVVVITIICAVVYIVSEQWKDYVSMMCIVQLFSSKWDVALASYCYEHKEQYYYDKRDDEVMYFIKEKRATQ